MSIGRLAGLDGTCAPGWSSFSRVSAVARRWTP